MWVCVCGVYVSTIKRKPADRNDLKLCTVVVLHTLSKLLILGSTGQGSGLALGLEIRR